MSFAYQAAARTYAAVGLETDVTSVDPAKLVVMLYEGALLAIGRARLHMLDGRIAEKGEALSRAIQIIDEGLKASLDLGVGGELARQLWQLYEYMCRRLLLASLHNDPLGLDEVMRLLGDLKDAWEKVEQSEATDSAGRGALPAHLGKVVPLSLYNARLGR